MGEMIGDRLRRLDLFNPSYKFVEREGNIPLSLGIDFTVYVETILINCL